MVVGEFTESVDLLIVGSGPGGYVAALRAAGLGRQVTLVDKAEVGGVCLNVGCIPSKALITVANEYYRLNSAQQRGIHVESAKIDMPELQSFKSRVVERLTGGVRQLLEAQGVSVVTGEARFVDDHAVRVVSEYGSQKLAFRQAVIASGSRPRELPELPFKTPLVMDSTDLLAAQEVPERLLVIGAGYIGLELGTAFAKLGSQVTVVESLPQILSGIDPALARPVARRLTALGVATKLSTAAQSIAAVSDNVAAITLKGASGSSEVIEANRVLVTVGRKPNTDQLDLERAGVRVNEAGFIVVDSRMRTDNPDIAAIGDVVPGPMLAHKASYEGKVAVESLSGQSSQSDWVAMPAVIFTDPEIAWAGMTEHDAHEAGYHPVVGRFPFAANGRALTLDDAVGEAVVIADQESGLLLGVQLVGPEVSSLIAEGTLALEMAATLEDLALTIHAHPTLSESIMEAAEVALGRPIHVSRRQL